MNRSRTSVFALAVARALAVVVACCAPVACNTPSAGASGALDGSADAKLALADAGDARALGSAASLAADAGADEDVGMPPTTSEELTARAKHLLEAIGQDNPELAADMVFPRDGYIGARDVADPSKLWEKKVSLLFKKQVHQLHKRKGIDRAQFISLELGQSVQQMTPKKRDWKKALWRVKHSRLTFAIDGKTFKIDIGEMTAWRGAWYVTRLRGA